MTQGNLGSRAYVSPMLTRIGTIPALLCADLLEQLADGGPAGAGPSCGQGGATAQLAN